MYIALVIVRNFCLGIVVCQRVACQRFVSLRFVVADGKTRFVLLR